MTKGAVPPTPERRALVLERRALRRAHVPGVVVATGADGALAVAAIRNLSVGGALIASGGLFTPGQRMPLTIHVAGRPPLHVVARVLRRQVFAREGDCALVFESIDDAARAAIVRALDHVRHPIARPRVVVVAPPSRSDAALKRGLDAAGVDAVVVRTALDDAAAVQRGAAALLVDEKLVESGGWNLLRWLAAAAPDVRRVVLAARVESFRLNLALRAGLAEAAVERPFTAAALLQRLGLSGRPRKPR